MPVALTQFHRHNVADTCAVWNLMASRLFYHTAAAVGCGFCCTQFVVYECLYKRRSTPPAPHEQELRERFRCERDRRAILEYHIAIQDLQTVELLSNRKRISKGELSSIAFALQTSQAFLSDDKGAFRLALTELDAAMVQTTSHLFGWLFYQNYLADHQKEQVISELEAHGRNMRSHYEDAYKRALESRLAVQGGCEPSSIPGT